jgi:hypothetical protein
MVATDIGAIRFAERASASIKNKYPGRPIAGFGDPAGDHRNEVDERTAFDVVNAQGIPIGPAPTNDKVRRREAVGRGLTRLTLMGRPALVIHPRCRVLRKGFNGGYCFRRVNVSGSDRYRDEPDKNEYSHVHDGLQYLMVGEGEDSVALESSTERRKVAQRFKVIPAGARRR